MQHIEKSLPKFLLDTETKDRLLAANSLFSICSAFNEWRKEQLALVQYSLLDLFSIARSISTEVS